MAIHFAAVAIASIKPKEKIVDLTDIPEATVEMSIEQQPEPPQPTPPPEEEPPPPPPPEAMPEENQQDDPRLRSQTGRAHRQTKARRTRRADVHVFSKSGGRQRSASGISL